MNKRPLISIVIPFYNEEGSVFGFHEAITKALANLSEYDFEFIFFFLSFSI
jgi:glycosyltransferase involved in cell wall biosynthesis